MSLAAARAEIAAALATLDDMQGFAERPDAIAPGSAWPYWRGWSRPDGGGLLLSRWEVQICVGATEREATDFVDARMQDVADALRPAGYIESVDTALFQTDAGDLYGVSIILTRE